MDTGNVRVFFTCPITLAMFIIADVVKIADWNSSNKGNKLDIGYKFFHKEFIHSYQGK